MLNTLSGVMNKWCPTAQLAPGSTLQGSNGGGSLVTCERFDWLKI